MKIPTHLYVVAKDKAGFIHGYDHKKPDDKKHQTQRDWAYYGHKTEGGVIILCRIKTELIPGEFDTFNYRSWDNKSVTERREKYLRIPYEEPAAFQPQIWENVPTEGFEIADYVSRYRGNKLMLVKDPRGLDLEITIKSFENIVQNCDISKGKLLGKYVWQANKNLIPAP